MQMNTPFVTFHVPCPPSLVLEALPSELNVNEFVGSESNFQVPTTFWRI